MSTRSTTNCSIFFFSSRIYFNLISLNFFFNVIDHYKWCTYPRRMEIHCKAFESNNHHNHLILKTMQISVSDVMKLLMEKSCISTTTLEKPCAHHSHTVQFAQIKIIIIHQKWHKCIGVFFQLKINILL